MRGLRTVIVASLLMGIALMFGCSGPEQETGQVDRYVGKDFKNKKTGVTKRGMGVPASPQ